MFMKTKLKKFWDYIKKHLKGLNKTICFICKKHHKFYPIILFDIIWCYMRYGTSYTEYRVFDYCLLDGKRRDSYLNVNRHRKLDKYLFHKKKHLLLNNNKEIFKSLDELLKRDIYNIKDISFKEFEVLALDKKDILCRGNKNEFKVFHLKDFRSPAFMLEKIKNEKLFWVEGALKQHKTLNEVIDEYSFISVVSTYDGKEADIVASSIKVNDGEGGKLTGYIDIKTGKVKANFRDDSGNIFTEHPLTKYKFKDLEIPRFKEVIELVKKAQCKFPNIREIEWHLYISSNKVIILGANIWDDYNFIQIGEYLKNRIGLMPYYEELIRKIKY